MAVAGQATDHDKREVDALIAMARKEYVPGSRKITAPIAALLFLGHNPHNSDWSPHWTQELARRMTAGQWQKNNATLGFYRDGQVEDGQHRLAAVALSGVDWDAILVFGIDREAIVTVDGPKKRDAADATKLDGIEDAKRKQAIIKTTGAYLFKAGEQKTQLRSETDIAETIKANNELLAEAIEIGKASTQSVITPVLKETQAQTVAYLMLKASPPWSSERIRAKLAVMQSGQSKDGENDPNFAAAEYITKLRKAREGRDRLTTLKELGVVMYAMLASERGIKVVRAQSFKDAVKSQLPKPGYPGEGGGETEAA